MKNTLAENMLRFGSKNLSEASKKKLQKLAEQTEGLNGVKSMLALPGVAKGATTTLTDVTDPTTKFITINTKANVPVPAGPILYAVDNNSGAVVSRLGSYNLVIGNIGEYDTANGIITSPLKQAIFTLENRLISKPGAIQLEAYLKDENGIAQLFAKLCLAAKNNIMVEAGALYTQQYNNLIKTFKLCTLTNTAPIPVAGDPTTDMKLAVFNKNVATYISRGGKS